MTTALTRLATLEQMITTKNRHAPRPARVARASGGGGYAAAHLGVVLQQLQQGAQPENQHDAEVQLVAPHVHLVAKNTYRHAPELIPRGVYRAY